MIDKGLEPLVDKIQKSALPTEFNRMRDLIKQLKKQQIQEDDRCKKYMADILLKRQQDQDIDDVYAKLLDSRKKRDIYAKEQRELFEKQFALQQNFIKMIDKNINDIEKDKEQMQNIMHEFQKNEGEYLNEF